MPDQDADDVAHVPVDPSVPVEAPPSEGFDPDEVIERWKQIESNGGDALAE